MSGEGSDAPTDEGPFADRSVLASDHRPECFPFRDDERATVRSVLSPAVRSGETACCLVCGPQSSGKRTTIERAIETLEVRDGAEVAHTAVVDCKPDATAYRIAIEASNALPGDDALADSGYSRETAFRRLRGRLREVDGVAILRLDHAQRVDPAELEALLAGLFDGSKDVRAGVVAVADGLEYRNELSVDTRRRFDQECYVGPYDAEEREAIVRDRIETAFTEECPGEVVDRCLAFAATTDAPLRTAFDVLDLAGDRAASVGDDALAIQHVEHAEGVVERERLTAIVDRRSAQERRTIAALLAVDDPRFDNIYERYCRQCRADGVTPNRERSVHNYLDALSGAGLIVASEGRSSAGGRYFEYELVHESETVEAVLDSTNDDAGAAADSSPGGP